MSNRTTLTKFRTVKTILRWSKEVDSLNVPMYKNKMSRFKMTTSIQSHYHDTEIHKALTPTWSLTLTLTLTLKPNYNFTPYHYLLAACVMFR